MVAGVVLKQHLLLKFVLHILHLIVLTRTMSLHSGTFIYTQLIVADLDTSMHDGKWLQLRNEIPPFPTVAALHRE
uniref:Uncharacterized protein n=1 Tax=Setaria italica TaxID=4555 RepID=K3ZKS0_SETIT